MRLPRFVKYIISSVLCSCLLSACDASNTSASLPLTDPQQQASTSLTSVWAEMKGDFQLDRQMHERPEVQAQITSLQANKEDFYKILENSAPYISYVYEETKKRGLPAELALLPVIESEGNPNARSKVGASGLWQLMPHTAHELGIKTNHAYDGRKDIIASTKGALAFLTDLHNDFKHNWLLAMAAYNWGPSSLQKAMTRKKGSVETNFWALRVPAETRKYIPKVLALAAIIQNPARYGFKLPASDQPVRLTSVEINSHYELREIMRVSGASLETMRRLNPAYRNLGATQGAPNTFLVPISSQKEFVLASSRSVVNNAKSNAHPYTTQHHIVSSGIRLAFSLSSAAALAL